LEISVNEIAFNSKEQKQSVELRYRVLREPLGLQFNPEDLEKEFADFHIAAFHNQQVVGILLLLPALDSKAIKMRQVAVDFEYQNLGVGKKMVQFAEVFALQKGFESMVLHARETAVPFYLSAGYTISGEPFTEVGIPHKKMIKTLL
jgi:predicted GNAT family N-acyltransferase